MKCLMRPDGQRLRRILSTNGSPTTGACGLLAEPRDVELDQELLPQDLGGSAVP